jgi:putative copper export protein
MVMWMLHAAPADHLSQSWLQAAMGTTVGRMEGARVLLALLVLWALALARRPAIALFLAAACLIVSGAIGHSAAISPALAIPSKAVHLLSIAMWLGGLTWLIIADRDDEASFRRESHRVSSVALWSVVAITMTGALQSFLFLGGVSLSLLKSAYGAFVAAKVIGVLILIAFGAYHRFRILPALDAGAPGGILRRSVRREILVLTAAVFIGGVMAYVPTPQPPAIHVTTSGEP